MERDKDPIHLLISYDTNHSLCESLKRIKPETRYRLWQKHALILSKKLFWSDGYLACSLEKVSSATHQRYIETQGEKGAWHASHPLKVMVFCATKFFEIHVWAINPFQDLLFLIATSKVTYI